MDTIGRFELRGLLGNGGFATVYRAWDLIRGEEVALKLLLPHLAGDPDMRRRFLTEARLLARLNHPNIVAIYDVAPDGDQPFYTMELIEGETLTTALARGPFSLEETLTTLTQLAPAVDALHAAGLVHRDIKPSNIMRARDGRVLLMDFGIAREVSDTPPHTGSMLGTPAAISPEQIRSRPVGPPADIYALGVLAYQLLAGRPPFTGDVASILHGHAFEQPPPLRDLCPNLPSRLAAAVHTALAKEPEQRPRSAGDFVAALERASDELSQPDTGTGSLTPISPLTPRHTRSRAGGVERLWPLGLAALALLAVAAGWALVDGGDGAGPLMAGTSATARPATTTQPSATAPAEATEPPLTATQPSTTAPATPAPEPTPRPPAPGDMLLRDDFERPQAAALPTTSQFPFRFRAAYAEGEYSLEKIDLTWPGLPHAVVDGSYGDASMTVDVRLTSDTSDRYIAVGCHAPPDALDSGYRVSLNPGQGLVVLDRWDGGAITPLDQRVATPALRRGTAANRIELRCAGGRIAVLVNGTLAVEAEDSTYREGRFWIGLESDAARQHSIAARLDNLVITQQ